MIGRGAALLLVLSGTSAPVLAQDKPVVTPPRGLGVTVPEPKALSPAQLARRARSAGVTLPAVLPPGATTTLTPVALRVGRTWIDLLDATRVSPRPGDVVAQFANADESGSVALEFDAPAGAVFVLDAFVHLWRPASRFRLPETTPPAQVLEVVATSPGRPSNVQTQSPADGHVVVAFRAATPGRQRVTIRGTECCWSFFRLELTRAS